MAPALFSFLLFVVVSSQTVEPPTDKRFYIQNVKSKLVMDIANKGKEEKAKVVMAYMDGTISQMWLYSDKAIINAHSGLSLAVESLAKPINNPVVMKVWDTGNDKKWFFENDGTIRTAHWDYVLTQHSDKSIVATSKGLGDHQKFEKVSI